MNLVFVTQSEPFYIKYFFRVFLEDYKDRNNIKGIIIQDTLGQKKYSRTIQKAFRFYGTVGFIYFGIKYMGIKASDILSRLINIQFNISIEQIARKYNRPILKFKSVNSKDFLDYIKKEGIDLIISVAASEIFKKDILNMPKYGCINIHSSPLPKYRGMMPNFWILYNNEKYAWVTIHKMVEKLDDGPIIFQDKFEIMSGETYHSLAKRSKKFAAKQLLKVLKQFEEGEIKYMPNDSSKATYYTFPTKEEIKQFTKKGGRMF